MSPHAEYPRPDFDRSHRWLSLNGEWEFAADPDDRGRHEHWEQPGRASWPERIQVPFAWETPLSGIGREWLAVGWYRRRIQRPPAWAAERTVLHVGAAHYTCDVWLNGRWIGEHEGGYLPFSFDVTDSLQDGAGELVLRVAAPLDKRFVPHGKQRSRPADDYDGVCFTATSGIWQPVWLEGRPSTYIAGVALRPGADLASLLARVTLAGEHLAGARLSLHVEGAEPQAVQVEGQSSVAVLVAIAAPQRWSPRTPHLYEVEVRLESADGEDRVRAYTGLRTISVQGRNLLLNGDRLYLRGVLDQGFWPRGGYTAPDGESLRRDVELTLAAGYNLARKHIKLEDPRWLYWADRLGLLVWEEPPCVSRYAPEAIARFEAQLGPMVARDGNHPSIVLWGIYNEEWGLDWRSAKDPEKQEAVARAYDLLAAADSSRPIIDDSGWWHVKTDVLDWHCYANDIRRWREITAAIAHDPGTWYRHRLGEDHWYDTQLSVPGRHLTGLPLINGEYGGGGTVQERGWHLRWQTPDLRRHDEISGYIYTELYDVEHELCGVYTFDRDQKDLGCDPATVNAETILLFDRLPDRPGCDIAAADGMFEVMVQVSHHGPEALPCRLSWAWDGSSTELGQSPLVVRPFDLTAPVPIRVVLPEHKEAGRLQIQLVDEGGRRCAASFLDVERLKDAPPVTGTAAE